MVPQPLPLKLVMSVTRKLLQPRPSSSLQYTASLNTWNHHTRAAGSVLVVRRSRSAHSKSVRTGRRPIGDADHHLTPKLRGLLTEPAEIEGIYDAVS